MPLKSTRITPVFLPPGVPLVAPGARRVCTRVLMGRPTWPEAPECPLVSLASGGDRPDCVAIAGRTFLYDRFHLDPKFPNTVADEFRRQWVRDYFERKRGDLMFVTKEGPSVTGFIILLFEHDELDQPTTVWVDLIGVAPQFKGQGLGTQLVTHSLGHCSSIAPEMKVFTQAQNPQGMRLYQSLGFEEIDRKECWHHE